MAALRKMYAIEMRNNSRPNIDLLKDAEKDGEFCFSYFPKILSLLEFSRILHWLADPTKGKTSARIDHDYLQKAIDVLLTVESRFRHHNSAWVASCHFIKKEVKEALTYTELAFYANTEVGNRKCFIQLCNIFIATIEGKKLEYGVLAFAYRRLKTAVATLLETYQVQAEKLKSMMLLQDYESMMHTLEHCKEKFCSAKLRYHTRGWRQSIKGFVNDVLYNLDSEIQEVNRNTEISTANTHVANDIVMSNPKLVEDVFVHKVLKHVSRKIEGLSKYIAQHTSIRPSTLDNARKFVSPKTYVPSQMKDRQAYNQAGKRYDFFVLHSDTYNDWVVCCLLQQLEYGQHGFKGKEVRVRSSQTKSTKISVK